MKLKTSHGSIFQSVCCTPPMIVQSVSDKSEELPKYKGCACETGGLLDMASSLNPLEEMKSIIFCMSQQGEDTGETFCLMPLEFSLGVSYMELIV